MAGSGLQPPALALTGERTLPGIWHENYWFRRHEAAYLALAPFTSGALVLEAGCGEGYGAALLGRTATRVVAVDTDPDAVAHAGRTYAAPSGGRVTAVRADLHRLPAADGAVDVVSCLQVVEHLSGQPEFVTECARVLRPAGTLLITTPNRLTFTPGRDTPVNPFHTRELAPDELTELLAPHFEVSRAWGLRHGRRIQRWESRHGPVFDALVAAGPEPQSWPAHVRRLVRHTRAADFAVGGGDLGSSLDLVYVAWRRP